MISGRAGSTKIPEPSSAPPVQNDKAFFVLVVEMSRAFNFQVAWSLTAKWKPLLLITLLFVDLYATQVSNPFVGAVEAA